MNKILEKPILTIDNHCEERIKPQLIRDVKTEAVLVFTRTALERYFDRFNKDDNKLILSTQEDTSYVYNSLKSLLIDLQKHVVNVEYLINLVQTTKQNPSSLELRKLAKYEEPLITYYDSMAKKIAQQFPSKIAAVPEFIVICVLSMWFLEEEKTSALYPFIKKYDTLLLIDKFEKYAQNSNDEEKKVFSQMQKVSIEVVEVLKNVKYKFNTDRKSKNRQSKSKRRQ